jgi:hypothetical protein
MILCVRMQAVWGNFCMEVDEHQHGINNQFASQYRGDWLRMLKATSAMLMDSLQELAPASFRENPLQMFMEAPDEAGSSSPTQRVQLPTTVWFRVNPDVYHIDGVLGEVSPYRPAEFHINR